MELLLARHTNNIVLQEHALEGEVTYWMHVDWMVAMTSRVACHYLI